MPTYQNANGTATVEAPRRASWGARGTLFTEQPRSTENPEKKIKEMRKNKYANLHKKKSENLTKKNLRLSTKKNRKSVFLFSQNRRSGFPNLDFGDGCRPAGIVVECTVGGAFRGSLGLRNLKKRN